MNRDSIAIELASITCVSTTERGHDEVYIKYSIDGGREQRFPENGYYAMSPGDLWETSLPITFKESVLVSLYDSDRGHDDFLGSHTYYPGDSQPESVSVPNTNGASYTLSTVAQG